MKLKFLFFWENYGVFEEYKEQAGRWFRGNDFSVGRVEFRVVLGM